MQAKGKQESQEFPSPAMCSPFPLKNACNMKLQRQWHVGKICGAKARGNHIKKEKQAWSHWPNSKANKFMWNREDGRREGALARTINRKVNFAGFCKGMEMIAIALWLEHTEDSSPGYTGPLDKKIHPPTPAWYWPTSWSSKTQYVFLVMEVTKNTEEERDTGIWANGIKIHKEDLYHWNSVFKF